MTERPKVLAC